MEATIDGESALMYYESSGETQARHFGSEDRKLSGHAAGTVVKTNKRGRPKGARTTTLAEVRKQAADEKHQLKRELGRKINSLQSELDALQSKYDHELAQLHEELEVYRRREANYRLALGERLQEVTEHLQTTLLNWGAAELKEARIDKRGRGRPRKTIKML